MKINLGCFDCMIQGNGDPFEFSFPINERNVYEVNCALGHSTTVLLSQSRFELLAEVGTQAIVDGYYREAVSSFAASLERFYEFMISLIMKATEREPSLDGTWKLVAAQSERQLGMFYGLYCLHFNSVPPTLPAKEVTFRNSVVHKGHIPDEADAVRYGQSVIDLIQPIIENLKKNHKSDLDRIVSDHYRANQPPAEGDQQRFNRWQKRMVFNLREEESPIDLRALAELRRNQRVVLDTARI